MKRREFIALLTGMTVGWPTTADTQQAGRKEPPVVGFLSLGSSSGSQEAIDGFQTGLAALGYVQDQNIRVMYRFADGKVERLGEMTTELVALGAKIIVTAGTTAIRAVHAAAPNVPIVSIAAADPVMMGWAQTLAKPSGMITGLFLFASTVVKPVEWLKEVRPQATTFGYLFHAANPGNSHFRRIVDGAAASLGIKVEIIDVKEPSELPDVFNRMAPLGVEGVAIIPDPVLGSHLAEIAELARLHKLPSVGDGRDFVDAGGLLALSWNYPAMAKRSAWFVDQILKGTTPGDLPAEQGTEFKLFANLKTAKALGLTIPPSLLARADEVID
jgi:putative tryptophan/tyrosine transport system substrate-binding protein